MFLIGVDFDFCKYYLIMQQIQQMNIFNYLESIKSTKVKQSPDFLLEHQN